MSDLSSLLKRVEAATGPDRELDAAIHVALSRTIATDDDLIYFSVPTKEDRCAPGTYWRKSRSGMSLRTSDLYTSSLDASLALVEEMLPGAEYQISTLYGIADVELPLNYAQSECIGRARREDGDVPLAVLSALLRALIAQKETADV